MNSPLDPDAQLMLSFQNGDEPAFDTLYERHYQSTINLAYRLLGDRDSAEDIAQEVFVKLYISPRSYGPRAKFSTWLYRVTYNACIDEMRKRKTSPTAPAQWDTSPIPDADVSPESVAESNELAAVVKAAIASLPEKQRLAIALQKYEGLSYQEIADVLMTSVSAVESLLFRAKESLKNKLSHYINVTQEKES